MKHINVLCEKKNLSYDILGEKLRCSSPLRVLVRHAEGSWGQSHAWA
jgi:hypothetical protein